LQRPPKQLFHPLRADVPMIFLGLFLVVSYHRSISFLFIFDREVSSVFGKLEALSFSFPLPTFLFWSWKAGFRSIVVCFSSNKGVRLLCSCFRSALFILSYWVS